MLLQIFLKKQFSLRLINGLTANSVSIPVGAYFSDASEYLVMEDVSDTSFQSTNSKYDKF
jgi:hypothetical protein